MPLSTVRTRERSPKWLSAGITAALVLALAACGDDGDDSTGPDEGTDVEDVTENDRYFDDDEYVGDEVTVSAEVTEVFGPTSFELAGDDWGDDSLLVVSAEDAPDLTEGQVVQVTGTVREFVYADYEADYGLGDIDIYEPYASEKFLEASSVAASVPTETDDSDGNENGDE